MSDIQISEKPDVDVVALTPPGADLHEFLRKATEDARKSGTLRRGEQEQELERNRNFLKFHQNALATLEIEEKALRSRENEGRGICDQIGQLATNHPEHSRDFEKAKAILCKITIRRASVEQHLANCRDNVKRYENAVEASNTPALQRSEKIRHLMHLIAG